MAKQACKNAARRFVIFLSLAGVSPVLDQTSSRKKYMALYAQYCALPKEMQREARRQGRRMIREIGIKVALAQLVPSYLSPQPTPVSKRSWSDGRKAYLAYMQRWPPDTHPCPVCRVWCGLPKRSWPNQESASAAR
jgi:hypothetical protein